ncbi:MAG: hypothetical protein WB239_14525 [Acidimicrobiia bacterium]
MALITPRSTGTTDQFHQQAILTLQPGRITELAGFTGLGMTRLGLRMLAAPSRRSPVVTLDVKGWLSPLAAWEVGVDPERLVVIRCPDPEMWTQLAAVLMEGVRAMYAEVPATVRDHDLRRLAALARARQVGVVLRHLGEGLPSGVAYLRLRALEVHWEGTEEGYGRLSRRHLVVEASGKAMAGMTRRIEMVDDGADLVCLVPGLGAGKGGRAAG